MSLGFGKVNPQDLDKLRQGGKADQVPPQSYVGQFVALRHLEPRGDRGKGAWVAGFDLTEANAPEFRGKHVEARFNYHPDPSSVADSNEREKLEMTNNISNRELLQLIDGANAQVMTDSMSGASDLLGTIQMLVNSKPVLAFDVKHREWNGKTYQDLGNFRPQDQGV